MKTLVIVSMFVFSVHSFATELTAVEAAFLAGVEMGKKGEINVSSYVVGEGHVLVEKTDDHSYSVDLYDGYDCGAQEISVKTSPDSNKAEVTGASLSCN